MTDRLVECASRAGRDFSEFLRGEKDIMQVLASIDQFTYQLEIRGCVNQHFVSHMMRGAVMQEFMNMANERQKENRRIKRAAKKRK
ncbi:hypothetical protein [Klebsiella pneumoniae]|uniref:hypothetical protein n=1 Tax=Klebsiella pneumoniae TaxID=573 RepID=UPI0024B10B25|nr:hypothetical protein [Klebsiella pneumoniae]MDI9031418.1 hypothetical protein [Klebsiella pneumoniae]HEN5213379.1 hypothetical protein [Klebsiella pneumoniae]